MKRDNGQTLQKNQKDIRENTNKRQEEFNKNRKGLEVNKEKKPFDKKAYRLKKYSKKYKLEQWEEQRKKRLLREYHKDIKNDPTVGSYKAKTFDEDAPDAPQTAGKYVRHPDLIEKENVKETEKSPTVTKVKKDPYHKAKEQFNKVKQEKQEKQQEIERIKKEKMQKLEEYKKKKNDRFKKLSKKTKKGQPVMTGRLELLLEKIQKTK
ncbi:thyroid transcription factor 1-associated protein 26 homolog [Spodoptera litura]|uniref:Thyroid transcription factor 1-associated protein 26 homolog n=1 Tax=Spodoptera litura TaxID=69820 RepID=A0A9J7DXE5_SPOLT|nr:thyroid transcription factor 1-associated protein 26 homolog [Spodoptera litura]